MGSPSGYGSEDYQREKRKSWSDDKSLSSSSSSSKRRRHDREDVEIYYDHKKRRGSSSSSSSSNNSSSNRRDNHSYDYERRSHSREEYDSRPRVNEYSSLGRGGYDKHYSDAKQQRQSLTGTHNKHKSSHRDEGYDDYIISRCLFVGNLPPKKISRKTLSHFMQQQVRSERIEVKNVVYVDIPSSSSSTTGGESEAKAVRVELGKTRQAQACLEFFKSYRGMSATFFSGSNLIIRPWSDFEKSINSAPTDDQNVHVAPPTEAEVEPVRAAVSIEENSPNKQTPQTSEECQVNVNGETENQTENAASQTALSEQPARADEAAPAATETGQPNTNEAGVADKTVDDSETVRSSSELLTAKEKLVISHGDDVEKHHHVYALVAARSFSDQLKEQVKKNQRMKSELDTTKKELKEKTDERAQLLAALAAMRHENVQLKSKSRQASAEELREGTDGAVAASPASTSAAGNPTRAEQANEIARLKKTIESTQAYLKYKIETEVQLQGDVTQLQQENQSLKVAMEQHAHAKDNADQQYAHLYREYETTKQQLEQTTHSYNELREKYQSFNDKAKVWITNARKKIDALKVQCHSFEVKHAEMERKHQEEIQVYRDKENTIIVAPDLLTAHQTIDQMRLSYNEVAQQLRTEQQTNRSLQEQMDQIRQEANDEVADLRANYSLEQYNCEAAQKELSIAQDETIPHLEKHVDELKSQLGASDEEKSRLISQLEGIKKSLYQQAQQQRQQEKRQQQQQQSDDPTTNRAAAPLPTTMATAASDSNNEDSGEDERRQQEQEALIVQLQKQLQEAQTNIENKDRTLEMQNHVLIDEQRSRGELWSKLHQERERRKYAEKRLQEVQSVATAPNKRNIQSGGNGNDNDNDTTSTDEPSSPVVVVVTRKEGKIKHIRGMGDSNK